MDKIELDELINDLNNALQYMSLKDRKETLLLIKELKNSSKSYLREEPKTISDCAISPQIEIKGYNEVEATKLINQYLRRYKIRIVQWSKSSCGFAYYKKDKQGYWRIKVPKPTNIDRFGIVMHEIYHCIDSFFTKPSYLIEFRCDKFALDCIEELGLDSSIWKNRMKWHVLSRVAMATNRGHKDVNKEIKEFYPDVNFESWYGKKVFVYIDSPKGIGYANPKYWDYLKIDIS